MTKTQRMWLIAILAVVLVAVIGGVARMLWQPAASHYELAQGAYLEGDFQTALDEINAAIADTPFNPELYTTRGLTQMQLANYDYARADFEYAIELDSDNTDVRPYLHLGWLLISAGYDTEAVPYLTSAIELNPSANLYALRGLARTNLGQTERAIEDLNEALALDATHTEALRSLGDAYYAMGEDANALDAYSRYLAATNNPAQAVLDRVDALNSQ